MVVVSPAGPEGPRRLAAAGAARVLVVGGQCPAEPGLEVWPGPLSAEVLPLRDASVDAVACLEGFAELADVTRRSLIAEARRVLREDGMLAVCTSADGAALWQAEGELHGLFANVVSFAELAWQGVSLSPVLAASPGESLTAAVREGLLHEPLPARRYLLLASSAPFAEPQRECVIIPTGPPKSADPAVEIAAGISAPEEIATPVAAAVPPPPIAPMPAISAPPDLDDLFGDAPTLAPTLAPAIAPPPPQALATPDPALLVELAELRRAAAGVERLREQAAEAERLRAQVAEFEQLRAAEAEHLREQIAEVERLRARAAEAERLREQVAEVEQLRAAEAEHLREQAAEQLRAAESGQLREHVAELEQLRARAAEADFLREQLAELERRRERTTTVEAWQEHAELEQLRERAAEAEQLRERVEQLRERAAEAEQLRERVEQLRERAAEAEQLREQLAARAPAAEPEQAADLARLREQLAELEPMRAELEELREDAVELVYLREQLAQLEPLRGRVEELERLRSRIDAVGEERDKLLAHAARLAGEIERAREEKARTEAELHSARLRIEALQRVPEDSRLHSLAALTRRPELPGAGPSVTAHELVDEVAPLVAPETGRATTDAALDRNRLREELARRTGELQTLETRVLQQEEELRRERLENVRLVTDVDRLREQVERSRAIELERVQELERLGHELRALEVTHAELQGLFNTQEQRLRDRGEPGVDDSGALLQLGDEDSDARERLDRVSAERDQLRARERASADLARRRDRELAEATRTVRELRRSVEEHASIAAELRGELVVLQVHVQRLEETLPVLQERLRDQQKKTLDREEEASELQRRLEEGVAEQEHLRGRLRKLRQDLDAIGSAKQGAEVELFRLRRELEAKHEAIEQLQQIVALGTSRFGQADAGELSDAARAEVLRLRATMAEQAAEHAEALARSEAEHQRVVEGERARLRRARLEAAIRAEEMEYMLFLLDTAEQKIWEMNDAEGRAAARLAAGLAQLDKQREQYEDLADELEVTRNLLVEAQAKVAELERLLDNERARLARVSLPPELPPDSPTSSFDVHVDEPDPETEDLVAPLIQHDPDESDRLAGINFDDDDGEPESLAVRLAASPVPEPTEADLAGLGSAEVSGPRFQLPSDDLDIDDEDDEPLPTRVVVVPDEDEDEDDEGFTIDTDWDDDDEPEQTIVARPAPRPPPPQKPQKPQEPAGEQRELSNARIVIELLEDEAWPDDESGGSGSG